MTGLNCPSSAARATSPPPSPRLGCWGSPSAPPGRTPREFAGQGGAPHGAQNSHIAHPTPAPTPTNQSPWGVAMSQLTVTQHSPAFPSTAPGSTLQRAPRVGPRIRGALRGRLQEHLEVQHLRAVGSARNSPWPWAPRCSGEPGPHPPPPPDPRAEPGPPHPAPHPPAEGVRAERGAPGILAPPRLHAPTAPPPTGLGHRPPKASLGSSGPCGCAGREESPKEGRRVSSAVCPGSAGPSRRPSRLPTARLPGVQLLRRASR